MNKGHIPIRTCISCGRKKGKQDLIRIVLDTGGQVVRDDRGGMKGRGAYVCRNEICQKQLWVGHRLSRAFRMKETMSGRPDLFLDHNG